MTPQDRTTLPLPTPETMALWSRQMLEMQKMLLRPTAPTDPIESEEAAKEDEDMWDNMPV